MIRRLVPVLGWRATTDADGGSGVDERVLALVREIARTGTLTAAANACGLPYRTAWGLLEQAARMLGASIVTAERGRGASLTPLARRWIARDEEGRALLASKELVVEFRSDGTPPAPKAASRITVAASNDLALAALKESWQSVHGVQIEFHGSAESLAVFRARGAHLAGFHVAVDAMMRDPLLASLHPARHVLVRFLTREQGLILARRNRKRVRRIADLASKGLSVVNRQPGSGTRLLADRLLAEAGIDPAVIRGYGNEEFTHAAVAATVASGRADAGFGVRAAAASFGLAFVPLAVERYMFACRRGLADSAGVVVFRALLAEEATRKVVAALPGYALDSPGEITTIAALT